MTFEVSTIRAGTSGEVAVTTYEDGSISVNCSPPSSQGEVSAPAGSLASCPGAVVSHRVDRDDAITRMGVNLIGPNHAETLFTCN
ncbi:MAG: hypothetical protein JWP01_534 [Myxococcales bacterium]|nr:hypothetical protein [Myxococcales bacterium]